MKRFPVLFLLNITDLSGQTITSISIADAIDPEGTQASGDVLVERETGHVVEDVVSLGTVQQRSVRYHWIHATRVSNGTPSPVEHTVDDTLTFTVKDAKDEGYDLKINTRLLGVAALAA